MQTKRSFSVKTCLMAMLTAICLCMSAKAAYAGVSYRLAAPTLSVSPAAINAAKLEWKAVDGAAGYRIYCRENTGAYKIIKKTSGTSMIHRNLKGGCVYYYRIQALADSRNKGVVNSALSNAKSHLTLSAAKPLLTAKVSGRDIIVRWKPVKNASGYAVYRDTTAGYKLVKTTTDLTYQMQGEDLGTRYSIIVRPFRTGWDAVQNATKRYYGTAASIGAVTAKTGYLTDILSPYAASGCTIYNQNSFAMENEYYSNGFTLDPKDDNYVQYKLNGKYKTLTMTVGTEDGVWIDDTDVSVRIYGDGRLLKTIRIQYAYDEEHMPRKYQISVSGVDRLKIVVDEDFTDPAVGFADVRVSR